MSNAPATPIALHLVRTLPNATDAARASESWDVTVGTLAEAHTHLDGYRAEGNWVTADATGADGAWLGTGRAGFGQDTRSDWA